MNDVQTHEITVTFKVQSTSRVWAYIHVMYALGRVDFGPIKGFNLGEVTLDPEPEVEEESQPFRESKIVESESDPTVEYVVTLAGGVPVACTCGDFIYRHAHETGSCKHMQWVGGD